jgi:hypothetical protein
MPTPDASQYTQFRKYKAIDWRPENGVKVFTHLYQPVPSVRHPIDFLPSFTNNYARPLVLSLPNHPSGPNKDPRIPAGRPVVGGQH